MARVEGTELPEESMAVIQSAYDNFKEKIEGPHTLKECFLNGFLYGMQFGMGVAEVPTWRRQRILKAFTGET